MPFRAQINAPLDASAPQPMVKLRRVRTMGWSHYIPERWAIFVARTCRLADMSGTAIAKVPADWISVRNVRERQRAVGHGLRRSLARCRSSDP
jgi:hypothetical protein